MRPTLKILPISVNVGSVHHAYWQKTLAYQQRQAPSQVPN